jgi:SAM-dependent methyltransferase
MSEKNARTVLAYEGYARTYAERTAGTPEGVTQEALERLVRAVGPKAAILEVGSGPGWDADYVESLGPVVTRTDAAQTFVDFQAERGRKVARLDLLADVLGGPYDGIMAMCVIQHIDRELVPGIFAKIAAALRPGGTFLFSVPEGEGDRWEGKAKNYHVVPWTAASIQAPLGDAGFRIEWIGRAVHSEGPWVTFLAGR